MNSRKEEFSDKQSNFHPLPSAPAANSWQPNYGFESTSWSPTPLNADHTSVQIGWNVSPNVSPPPPFPDAPQPPRLNTVSDGVTDYPPVYSNPSHLQDTGLPNYNAAAFYPPIEPLKSEEQARAKASKTKRGSCAFCCKTFFSIVGHAGFVACLVCLIIYAVVVKNPTVVAICGAFLGVSAIIILVESCFSDTSKYLRHFLGVESFLQYTQRIKGTRPTLSWHASCYHYETRTRTVSHRDGNGNTQWRTETYRVRVDTHSESREMSFGIWRDASGEPPDLPRGNVTRVNLSKSYIFMDENASSSYSRQRQVFYQQNVHRDAHMDFTEHLRIEGFLDRVTAYVDENSRNCCMTSLWYWLCTLLCMTWPYRIWFRTVTKKCDFAIVKEIGL